MREAIAREAVFGKKDSRDDAASKAMYQMKSLSMEEFELCARTWWAPLQLAVKCYTP